MHSGSCLHSSSVCCLLAGGAQGQGFQVDSSCVSEACVTVTFYLSWFSVSQFTNSKIKTLAEEEVLMVNVFVVVGIWNIEPNRFNQI